MKKIIVYFTLSLFYLGFSQQISLSVDKDNVFESENFTLTANLDTPSNGTSIIRILNSGTSILREDYLPSNGINQDISVFLGGNGLGQQSNQMNSPERILSDSFGNFYVYEKGIPRVSKWNTLENQSTTFAIRDDNESPLSITIDSEDNLYVLYEDNSVYQYNTDGVFIRSFNVDIDLSSFTAIDLDVYESNGVLVIYILVSNNLKSKIIKIDSNGSYDFLTIENFMDGESILSVNENQLFVSGRSDVFEIQIEQNSVSYQKVTAINSARDMFKISEDKIILFTDFDDYELGSFFGVVLEYTISTKQVVRLLTSEEFIKSTGISIPDNHIDEQSKFKSVAASSGFVNEQGDIFLSVSKDQSKYEGFDNTFEDRVIKIKGGIIIKILDGNTSGSLSLDTFDDQLTEGRESIIFTGLIENEYVYSDPIEINLSDPSVNFPPSVVDIQIEIDEDNSVQIPLQGSDLDGDNLTYEIFTNPRLEGFEKLGEFNGSTYYYSESLKTFDEALNISIINGADLLTITSQEEQDFINESIISKELILAWWLGLTDEETEGVWKWVNGEEFEYSSWANGEPNNQVGGEDYVHIRDSNSEWNDVPGDTQRGVILEFKNDVLIANGEFTLTDNIVTYTPDNDFYGIDSFRYKAYDGRTESEIATVTVTVNPVNDNPIIDDLTIITNENKSVEITLSSFDTDDDIFTYSITEPSNGSVSLDEDQVTYTPNTNFSGTDTFTYISNDGESNSEPATITVNVLRKALGFLNENIIVYYPFSGNTEDYTDDRYNLKNENEVNLPSISNDRFGLDNESLFFDGIDDFLRSENILNTSVNFSISFWAKPTSTHQIDTEKNNRDCCVYDGANGQRYIMSPSHGGVDWGDNIHAGLGISMGTNGISIYEHRAFHQPGLLVWESETELNDWTHVVVNYLNNKAYLFVNGVFKREGLESVQQFVHPSIGGEDGGIGGGLENNYYKGYLDDFAIFNKPLTEEEILRIYNGEFNIPPTSESISSNTEEDIPIEIVLQGEDTDGDTLTYSITDPSNGSVSLDGNQVTYTPNPNFNGTDSFTYIANDGEFDSDPATITITVVPVNDDPTVSNLSSSTNEDTSVEITLSGTDIDEDSLTFSVTDPSNGSVSLDGDQVTYTPNPNFNGTDSFTYIANDGEFDSDPATVTITIVPVNDDPTVSDLSSSTNEDTSVEITLSGTDIDEDSLTFSVTDPSNGLVSHDGDVVTYTPNSNFNGTDSFTYTASDGTVDSEAATVSVTVNSVEDSPKFSMDDEGSLSEDATVGSIITSLEANDGDGDTLTFSLSENTNDIFSISEGKLILNKEIDYESATSHSVIITVSDGELSDTLDFTLNVEDIPNNSVEQIYSIEVYDVENEDNTERLDYRNWTNSTENTEGGDFIFEISGGEDAALFTIDPVTGALDFIEAPDYENPSDTNEDNIYVVMVKITNVNDGAPELPVISNQTTVAVPESQTAAVDIDIIVTTNDADTDQDGIVDTEDNCPTTYNPGQEDTDGDGVGDVCDDSDMDTYFDAFDECPSSRFGARVNAAGCETFSLPIDTFSVTVTSSTCPGSSNGSITIGSSNTDYSYRYALDDQAPVALSDNTQTISNLSAGIYTVCVTVDGVADYNVCYTIEITEPAPLVASSRVDVSSRNMQLDLSGSEEYQVTLNGKTFLTTKEKLSLNLEPGMNRVEVATALDCQGVYFEEIFVSEEVKVYPNPTSGPLQLFVAGSDAEVELSITGLSGNIIKREILSVPSNRIVETSLGRLPEGLYLITLSGTTVKTTHKVIKE